MIDPTVLLTLETKNEIHIVCALDLSSEPMRNKDIAEFLNINTQRCGQAYQRFGL